MSRFDSKRDRAFFGEIISLCFEDEDNLHSYTVFSNF